MVVRSTACVTIDGEVKLLTENQSIYVPLGSLHRLENPGLIPSPDDLLKQWDTLTVDEKKLFTRQADVYAAYLA
jgi:hypothetical protein